jgi:hypothetical protein
MAGDVPAMAMTGHDLPPEGIRILVSVTHRFALDLAAGKAGWYSKGPRIYKLGILYKF